jgi:2'-5' RNA ligase
MSTLRCFIAIDFDQTVIQSIVEIQKSFKNIAFLSIRWVKADNLHLTLKFLGETDSKKIPLVKEIMDRISTSMTPFNIRLSQMGVFPGWRNPRILWLGIEKSDDILSLASKIEKELESLGFPGETRPFSPHLTIGRIKDDFPFSSLDSLRNKCKEDSEFVFVDIVSKINFYKSDLQPQGPKYSLLHSSVLRLCSDNSC